jgi:hypothetical protein
VIGWLRGLLSHRGRRALSSLPLGVEGELAWHCSLPEARRILRRLGALSLEVDGNPTARLRWGKAIVRAQLEFVSGVYVPINTWLPANPDAAFYTRDGLRVAMEPRLRGASVLFSEADRRGNWQKALEMLGKPTRRLRDGSWLWDWPLMTARFVDADPDDSDSVEWLRFAPTATSRVLEIRNQSSHELYEAARVRVDFQAGRWEMTEQWTIPGVPVRLHWDVPAQAPGLVTVVAGGRESSVEISQKSAHVVLTNDGTGGVRLVV